MLFFDKLDKPVFLKEESDIEKYISRLKELREKASYKIKDKIDLEIKLASIGQFGEKNIAFELRNSGMPMYILHDIHLEINGLSAQIDYIVITRKVTFIIECKNLIGNIQIDKDGNFIRDYELSGRRIKEGIYSPITQNLRHLEVLRQIRRNSKSNVLTKLLFDKYFYDNYKTVVVLANPKTILNAKYAKKEVRDMIIRADQLNKYINDIYQHSKLPALNDNDMKDFAMELLELHTPSKSDYAKKYEDLINIMNFESEQEKALENKEEKLGINNYQIMDNGHLNVEEELTKKLKAFRLQKSREENIKAYYIFNDKQMIDLINKLPRSKEELKNVSGFGEVKIEKYGDVILKIINEYR